MEIQTFFNLGHILMITIIVGVLTKEREREWRNEKSKAVQLNLDFT